MRPVAHPARCAALAVLAIGLSVGSGAAQEAVMHIGPEEGERRLLLRGTTDIAAFGPVLEAFAGMLPDLSITYEQWGSNELYGLTERSCRAGAADADLVISSAVDLQVRLVNDGCARPHRSEATSRLPAEAKWRDEVFGVTQEPAVIVYNRERVPPGEIPYSRFDLIDLLRPPGTRFAGRVATYDIETSGLGYLFAFADSQQATTFGSLLEAFGRSGAVATCCSAEIIDGVAEGTWLIAYNVLGSYALARAATDDRIGVVAPHDYTLVLSRAAMIPKGSRQPELAGQFIDFLLGDAGRRALAEARLFTALGDPDGSEVELTEAAETRLRPIALSPKLLVGLDQHKRAQFLERWHASLDAPSRELPR